MPDTMDHSKDSITPPLDHMPLGMGMEPQHYLR